MKAATFVRLVWSLVLLAALPFVLVGCSGSQVGTIEDAKGGDREAREGGAPAPGVKTKTPAADPHG